EQIVIEETVLNSFVNNVDFNSNDVLGKFTLINQDVSLTAKNLQIEISQQYIINDMINYSYNDLINYSYSNNYNHQIINYNIDVVYQPLSTYFPENNISSAIFTSNVPPSIKVTSNIVQEVNQYANLVFDIDHNNLISVVDTDSNNATEKVVLTIKDKLGDSLSEGLSPGNLIIDDKIIAGSNILVKDNGTDQVTITGTIVQLNKVLDGLKFSPSLNYYGISELKILIDDLGNTGVDGSKTDSKIIEIAQNAALLDLTNPAVNMTIQTPFILNGANAVTISDHSNASNVYIKLIAANGKINFIEHNLGDAIVVGDNTSTIIIQDSIGNINADLQKLVFTPDLNFSGKTNIQIMVNDLPQGTEGIYSFSNSIKTFDINVNSSTVTLNPLENINLNANVLIADNYNILNRFSLNGVNLIQINDLGVSNDTAITLQLKVNNGNIDLNEQFYIASISSGLNNIITINDTVENINHALQYLTFTPTSGFNGTANIEILANDLPGVSIADLSSYKKVFNININDAVSNLLPMQQTVNISSHTTPDVNLINAYNLVDNVGNNLINISDAGNPGSDPITIQLLAQHGRLDFNTIVSNAAITSGDNNKITITDTLSNINTILKSLIFTPTVGFNGNAAIQVVTNNLPNILTADNNSDTSNYWQTLH
ncbi:MAG: hypothetical protein ACR2HS_02125, partial [Gammaproteobacteria bacterium]